MAAPDAVRRPLPVASADTRSEPGFPELCRRRLQTAAAGNEVLLFRREKTANGCTFNLYAAQAEFVADQLLRSRLGLLLLQGGDGGDLLSLELPHFQLPAVLRALVRVHKREVVVLSKAASGDWTQVLRLQAASPKSDFRLPALGVPEAEGRLSLAVKVSKDLTVGVALVDPGRRQIGVAEFCDVPDDTSDALYAEPAAGASGAGEQPWRPVGFPILRRLVALLGPAVSQSFVGFGAGLSPQAADRVLELLRRPTRFRLPASAAAADQMQDDQEDAKDDEDDDAGKKESVQVQQVDADFRGGKSAAASASDAGSSSSSSSAGDLQQDLARLVGGKLARQLSLLDLGDAMQCVKVLIKRLELLTVTGAGGAANGRSGDEAGDAEMPAGGGGGAFGDWQLLRLDAGACLQLDEAAVQALNVFPQATDSEKTMSLFGLLNHCRTALGRRLLQTWLRYPSADQLQIEARHRLVESLLDSVQTRQELAGALLRRVPDLDRLLEKFLVRRNADLQAIVSLYLFAKSLPAALVSLGKLELHKEDVAAQWLRPLRAVSNELSLFQEMVEATVDLDALGRHEYLVSSSFNPSLGRLKTTKDEIMAQMEALSEQTAETLELEAKKVKLQTVGDLGWHLRVSRADEKALRKHAKFTSLETRKDGVRFTSSALERLDKAWQKASREYNEEQQIVVEKAVEISLDYLPLVETAGRVLARVDVLQAFAQASLRAPAPYVRPRMRPMGAPELRLEACRHACLEHQALPGTGGRFIANDVHFRRGQSGLQLITGPNTGGKSCYIRQTGVAVLLAHVGCFVPATEAELPVFSGVLARVGAGDNLRRGLSTFLAELLEAGVLLREAGPHSLVILDELGRGTSTKDGFGLAWAIAEYLARRTQAFGMFATHFHELTEMARVLPNVVNLHVTAQLAAGGGGASSSSSSASSSSQQQEAAAAAAERLILLYKVAPGACDQSFGVQVAGLSRFPQPVVRLAHRKLEQLEQLGSAAGARLRQGKRKAPAEDDDADSGSHPEGAARAGKRLRHSLHTLLQEFGVQAADPDRLRALLRADPELAQLAAQIDV